MTSPFFSPHPTIKTLLLQLHSLDANVTGNKGLVSGSGNGPTSAGGGDNNSGGGGGGGGSGANSTTTNKGAGGSTAVPLMFTKLVTTKASHIETILKLVGTPEGPILVERFKIMWPDGTAGSLSRDQHTRYKDTHCNPVAL